MLRSVVNLPVNTWRYTSDPPDGDADGRVVAAEAEGYPESRSAAARVALTGSAESSGMSEGGFRTQTAP
ncbi:hypothetical protein ACIQVA_35175 [Streptomyces microflavus]|uniref:hypothetical protein n=1 Tax=Streptomyces microflavus TaxID=1919 RepID=UPI00381BE948